MAKVAHSDTMNKWRSAVRDKSEIVRSAANTPAGKKLLDLMEETFCNQSLRRDSPYDTYYALGQRDVVQYLRELGGISNE